MGRGSHTTFAAFLVGVLHFIAGLPGSGGIVVLSGALAYVLAFGLWSMRGNDEAESNWDAIAPALAAMVGILIGAAGRGLLQASAPGSGMMGHDGIAFGVAASLGFLMGFLKRRRRGMACFCCQKPLGRQASFCPRCREHVCENCWRAEFCRCAFCERLKAPLLTLEDDDWWSARIGKRLSVGECNRCRRSAVDRDLRKCGNCIGAMCLECWDMENGRCFRCDWLIPDLPEVLSICHETENPWETSRSHPTN